jgi:nitroreductase
MDLSDGIRGTGTVRQFTDRPVDRTDLEGILDDARFAPSGGNRQPWKVAVVDDHELRRRLAELMQPVWNEYATASRSGQVPFNSVSYSPPDLEPEHVPNSLLDEIASVPVVLVVAADLHRIVAADAELDRAAIVPGASIYPFCWNIMLAARQRRLGGVMTTFMSRVEPAAGALLGLPDHHALAATIFLGHPVHQPTRLKRAPVSEFATVDRFDGPPFTG